MASCKCEWKWFVCFGAFLIHFVISGFMNSGGVLMSALVDEFGKPRGETAWVSSISSSMVYLLGPASTYLCERFGCRIAITSGLILCFVGLIASAFTTSLPVLYFTYGVLWGSGGCLIYFSSFLTIAWYFKLTEYAFANGIATAGAPLGEPWCLHQSTNGCFNILEYAFLTFMVHHLLFLVPLIAFKPHTATPVSTPQPSKTVSTAKPKKNRWAILKNYGYLALLVSLFLFMGVYMVPFIHVVRLGEDLGASKTESALLISYMSISSFVGRLFFGRLSDGCCNRLRVFQLAIAIVGVSTALLSLAPSYPWVVVYVIVFGIFEGCYISLNAVVTRDIVGKEHFPTAIGFSYFVMSFSRTVGPPIVGWMYDAADSYFTAFIAMGILCLVSAFIQVWIPLLQKISDVKIELELKREEVKLARRRSSAKSIPPSELAFTDFDADDVFYVACKRKYSRPSLTSEIRLPDEKDGAPRTSASTIESFVL